MRKLAFVTDTSVILTEEYKHHPDIYQIPLNVVVNGQTFEDKREFKDDMWVTALKNDDDITTSLPSVDRAVSIFETVKAQGYETVFVSCISSNLSGTFNLLRLAISTVEMDNVVLLDTKNALGAVGYLAEIIFEGAKRDLSDEQIEKQIDLANRKSILYALPKTLYNIAKSGRISPAIAKIASLIRVNAILEWEAGYKSLELATVSRSVKKALEKIIQKLQESSLNKERSRVYVCTIEDKTIGDTMEAMIRNLWPNIKIIRDQIPGIISVHGGLGCLVVQMQEIME